MMSFQMVLTTPSPQWKKKTKNKRERDYKCQYFCILAVFFLCFKEKKNCIFPQKIWLEFIRSFILLQIQMHLILTTNISLAHNVSPYWLVNSNSMYTLHYVTPQKINIVKRQDNIALFHSQSIERGATSCHYYFQVPPHHT